MRSIIREAIWGAPGRRNTKAAILHQFQGKFDPELARLKRVLKSWIRESSAYAVPVAYWNTLCSSSHKGPIGLIHEIFADFELLSDDPNFVLLDGIKQPIRGTHGVISAAIIQAKKILWRKVSQESDAYKGPLRGPQ